MSQTTHVVAVPPINKEMVLARFEVMRAEHPNGLTKMEDYFGLALLMAEYDWRIDNAHELANMELAEFIEYLMNSTFVELSGPLAQPFTIVGASTIGVHHQKLGKHFLVQLLQDRRILHNAQPLEVTPEQFEVEVNIAGPILEGSDRVQVAHSYKLTATGDDESPGDLIDLTWLGEFEGADLVLEVPKDNVRTSRRVQL